MTLITKNSYIDNWYSKVANTIEVGWFKKRCFIERGTGKVVSNNGVPSNSQAYKMALSIAKNY